MIVYLWASILLYLLLGGADFGAGIIELFTSEKNRSRTRKTMYQAIGPIWEANHMWLIIAIDPVRGVSRDLFYHVGVPAYPAYGYADGHHCPGYCLCVPPPRRRGRRYANDIQPHLHLVEPGYPAFPRDYCR